VRQLRGIHADLPGRPESVTVVDVEQGRRRACEESGRHQKLTAFVARKLVRRLCHLPLDRPARGWHPALGKSASSAGTLALASIPVKPNGRAT
jgi:hypothetical protein